MKNILSVFKINQHGSLAVIIPAKEARELGITEESMLTFTRVRNSICYTPLVIE